LTPVTPRAGIAGQKGWLLFVVLMPFAQFKKSTACTVQEINRVHSVDADQQNVFDLVGRLGDCRPRDAHGREGEKSWAPAWSVSPE